MDEHHTDRHRQGVNTTPSTSAAAAENNVDDSCRLDKSQSDDFTAGRPQSSGIVFATHDPAFDEQLREPSPDVTTTTRSLWNSIRDFWCRDKTRKHDLLDACEFAQPARFGEIY